LSRRVVKCRLRLGRATMTPTEVLREIQKLSLNEALEVANRLNDYLRENGQTKLADENSELLEDEFERYLLAKGTASHIATRDEVSAALIRSSGAIKSPPIKR